nr:MAG TPA: hypothetical protein [Ackermannviridae sp.]
MLRAIPYIYLIGKYKNSLHHRSILLLSFSSVLSYLLYRLRVPPI